MPSRDRCPCGSSRMKGGYCEESECVGVHLVEAVISCWSGWNDVGGRLSWQTICFGAGKQGSMLSYNGVHNILTLELGVQPQNIGFFHNEWLLIP